MSKLKGKVAVITGASSAMGLAAVKRFLEEGMGHVFITGRRKDALDAAVDEIWDECHRGPGLSLTTQRSWPPVRNG